MPTGLEIGLGLFLNIAFWIAVIGGATCAAAWALIEYGPSAGPIKKMKSRGRSAAKAAGRSSAAGSANPAPQGVPTPANADTQDPRKAA